MKIVLLTPNQFDEFSNAHPLHSYYQSSNYANLMHNYNYNIYYYGFVDDDNILIGATMLLTQNLVANYKYAYAPRGFLMDYDNLELVQEVSEQFRSFLAKHRFVFLKIDPKIINNKRDKEGNIVPSPYENKLVEYLTSIGYAYFGENKFFGTLKPRWNAVLKVSGSAKTIFNKFDRSIKNKIRKAQSRGIEIIKGSNADIPIFYNFVAKKHNRKLDYYKKFAEAFGNKLEIYFAKLDSESYLQNIKVLLENEQTKNEEINSEIQNAGYTNSISTKLTNSKITSDNLLALYKNELIKASALFTKNPNGIIIGASAFIIGKNGVDLLIEGYNPKYSLFYPTFLIKWFVIEKYAKEGAILFDLNAITGYFAKENKYRGLNEMKLGFGADITEYIGEFDLIINKRMYTLYSNTKLLN